MSKDSYTNIALEFNRKIIYRAFNCYRIVVVPRCKSKTKLDIDRLEIDGNFFVK